MALFFSPSKTGLLGPKPDMFSQLGKGEEWMPEDSLGGFCLGKHPACGRHWATQHVHWACGLRNQYLFPSRSPKCFVGHICPRVRLALLSCGSFASLDRPFCEFSSFSVWHRWAALCHALCCVSCCSLSTRACSLCSDSSSEEGEHWVTHS